jgi:hypothetical protein
LQGFIKKIWKIFETTTDAGTDQFRTLNNEVLCDSYRSADIVGARVTQSV